MKRDVAIRVTAAVVATAFIAAGSWMLIQGKPLSSKPHETPSAHTQAAVPASPAQPVLAVPVPPARPASPAAAAQPVDSSRDALSMVREFDKLFTDSAPGQTAEQAKELMARRKQARQDLVDRLADLGQGGARSIADAFNQSQDLRDRLALAEALGRIKDSGAVSVIKELLAGQSDFYERKELITSLAHRPESSAVEPLAGVLTPSQPGALQFAAVQGLAGRSDALPVLDATIQNGNDQVVRLEAIRSVGLMANDSAKAELTNLAEKSALEPLVRQTAIQELRRSFGTGAQDVLQTLSNDPEPIIRDTASQALAMLHR